MFDWNFRFGDILTLVGGMSIAASFLYRRGSDESMTQITLKNIREELTEMKSEFSEFSKAMTTLAVQDTKINMLMKWYDELRRGIGKINS